MRPYQAYTGSMKTEQATLGGGCYWCLDAIYRRIEGVTEVHSGYSGGHVEHPTVDQVYGGGTGHAEVVQVSFDPDTISFREILEIFFVLHDPTTLNRQGHDVGEIYRSVIFYQDDTQKAAAEDMIAGFAADIWSDPVVTALEPFSAFWPAEDYMQDYYAKNPRAGYCMAIIDPKIQKLRQKYAARLKPDA